MNKLTKKYKYNSHLLPSVSMVTIHQLSRASCLRNLYTIILAQDYKHIIQWVIVEGSQSIDDANQNAIYVNQLIQYHNNKNNKLKIHYVKYSGLPLSDLRNIGHEQCKGDIIVIMDDDDYYPPMRITHAVNKLTTSTKCIAGCSAIYMYDYSNEQLYQSRIFHNNHSTNNCFAFKKSYLTTHSHQKGLLYGEEKSFTNQFTEPMIQLNPKKCIIVSIHGNNTFDKKPLLSTSLMHTCRNSEIHIPTFHKQCIKQLN